MLNISVQNGSASNIFWRIYILSQILFAYLHTQIKNESNVPLMWILSRMKINDKKLPYGRPFRKQ